MRWSISIRRSKRRRSNNNRGIYSPKATVAMDLLQDKEAITVMEGIIIIIMGIEAGHIVERGISGFIRGITCFIRWE
jgi:hypothetical protein